MPLLASAIVAPGDLAWVFGTFACSILSKVLYRRGWIEWLPIALFPNYSWTMSLFGKQAIDVLHKEMMVHLGYAPRFVPPLALILGRMVARVPDPYFSMHAVVVLLVAFFAEVLEDVVVYSGAVKLPQRTAQETAHYTSLESTHPYQIYSRDGREGLLPTKSQSFHGMRQLKFSTTVLVLFPSAIFSIVMLELLLGPGMVYGVCIPGATQAANRNIMATALQWDFPLNRTCN